MKLKWTALVSSLMLLTLVFTEMDPSANLSVAKTVTPTLISELQFGVETSDTYINKGNEENPSYIAYSFTTDDSDSDYGFNFRSKNDDLSCIVSDKLGIKNGESLGVEQITFLDLYNGTNNQVFYIPAEDKGLKKNTTYYVTIYGDSFEKNEKNKYSLTITKTPYIQKDAVIVPAFKSKTFKKKKIDKNSGMYIDVVSNKSKLGDFKINVISGPKKGVKKLKQYNNYYYNEGELLLKKGIVKGTYKIQIVAKDNSHYKGCKSQKITIKIK